MKTRLKIIISLLIVAFLVGGAAVYLAQTTSEQDEVRSAKEEKQKTRGKNKRNKKQGKDRLSVESAKKNKVRKVRTLDFFSNLTAEDRALAEALQTAQDNEKFKGVLSVAKKALVSKNPEIRIMAIESLEWFEDKAIPELTGAMADANSEVAEAARNSVENVLMAMEDNAAAFQLSVNLLSVFKSNEEAVTVLSGVMSNVADSLIEPEDESEEAERTAAENRVVIVETIADLIGSGGFAEREGKEVYESITGEEWLGVSEARRWAENPDDYEPSDDSSNDVVQQ